MDIFCTTEPNPDPPVDWSKIKVGSRLWMKLRTGIPEADYDGWCTVNSYLPSHVGDFIYLAVKPDNELSEITIRVYL
jgi:hypothetical protein